MSRTRLVSVFVPLVLASAAAAFAATPAPELSQSLSELHAVSQWSVTLSKMADDRAKSDLVKNYAKSIVSANPGLDTKITAVAEKKGIDLSAPDTQTDEGKSVNERMKAEAAFLGTLDGDAFDKEYMTLVTNTQQSVLNLLKASKASAKDPDAKQLMGELTTTIQGRVKTAQEIMSKVYGNQI
jgi:predicted outer membrane protein